MSDPLIIAVAVPTDCPQHIQAIAGVEKLLTAIFFEGHHDEKIRVLRYLSEHYLSEIVCEDHAEGCAKE